MRLPRFSARWCDGSQLVKLLERGLGMKKMALIRRLSNMRSSLQNNHLLRPTRNPDIRSYDTIPAAYGTFAAFAPKPADMAQATYDNFAGTPGQKGYYQYWKEKAYAQCRGEQRRVSL